MNFEKYTERARGFVQSAQTMALGRGHQQFAPEHLLKVLLDDPEGMASGLINAAGGDAARALAAVDRALEAMPRVSGGNGQLYLTAPTAKVFSTAEALADKSGGRRGGCRNGENPEGRRRHRQRAQRGSQRNPQGPYRRQCFGRERL
ncbi:MAG: clpB 1 [Proteobacteria bacterium]|nr:clpB 1 [Pseudomonadota bacterium]